MPKCESHCACVPGLLKRVNELERIDRRKGCAIVLAREVMAKDAAELVRLQDVVRAIPSHVLDRYVPEADEESGRCPI